MLGGGAEDTDPSALIQTPSSQQHRVLNLICAAYLLCLRYLIKHLAKSDGLM